jgi:ABC-2 type transport system ATP-binding protein
LPQIDVRDLKKYYQVHEKEAGFGGSLRSFAHRRYGNVKAVDGIGFQIEEGEMVGFLGPNSAGKTTTLKVLAGLLHPTNGWVRIPGFTPQERKPVFLKQITLIIGQKNQLNWDLPAMESFIVNQVMSIKSILFSFGYVKINLYSAIHSSSLICIIIRDKI